MEEENEKVEKEVVDEPQKGIPPELEKMIRAKISQMSNGVFSEQEQDEIYDSLSENEILASQEKGILEAYLNTEIRKIIIEKLREKNKDNESSKEQPAEQQKEEKQKKEEEEEQQEEQVEENIEESSQDDLEKVIEEEPKEEEKEKEDEIDVQKETENVPEDVKKACERIGVNKIKGYFYVNANDLNSKVDNTLVNKHGNRVLMLQVESEKIDGPDRYYGMQDDRLVVYGNEDQAVREVTGKVNKMGKIVEPLKLQEPKAVEYSDDDGLVINEQIDDNRNLSVQEANNYRDEMIELLEKYSRNVELIEEDSSLTLEEKTEMLGDVSEKFYSLADQIALKYDIRNTDTKNIMVEIEEHTEEEIQEETEEIEEEIDDEPDYFEVPGKRTH